MCACSRLFKNLISVAAKELNLLTHLHNASANFNISATQVILWA